MQALTDRLMAAQQKDVEEMRQIVVLTASNADPDASCALVVGGEYRLSDAVKQALIAPR